MSKITKSWRDVLPVHPAADLFPMMTADELKALSADIEKRGTTSAVVLWAPGAPPDPFKRDEQPLREWQLLDGRNRLDALEMLGIPLFNKHGRPTDYGHESGNPFVRFERLYEYGQPYDISMTKLKKLPKELRCDPYEYVLSANAHRRHLTPEQRREVIAKVLKAQPSKSNRTIAKQTKVSHHTVENVRKELEGRGQIAHVETREDTKGRKQPTYRERRAASDPNDAKVERLIAAMKKFGPPSVALAVARGVADGMGYVEEGSDVAHMMLPSADKLVAERAETAARVEVKAEPDKPKQSDIERVLPPADKLVLEILERDAIAPGYARQVLDELAACLDPLALPACLDRRRRAAEP